MINILIFRMNAIQANELLNINRTDRMPFMARKTSTTSAIVDKKRYF